MATLQEDLQAVAGVLEDFMNEWFTNPDFLAFLYFFAILVITYLMFRAVFRISLAKNTQIGKRETNVIAFFLALIGTTGLFFYIHESLRGVNFSESIVTFFGGFFGFVVLLMFTALAWKFLFDWIASGKKQEDPLLWWTVTILLTLMSLVFLGFALNVLSLLGNLVYLEPLWKFFGGIYNYFFVEHLLYGLALIFLILGIIAWNWKSISDGSLFSGISNPFNSNSSGSSKAKTGLSNKEKKEMEGKDPDLITLEREIQNIKDNVKIIDDNIIFGGKTNTNRISNKDLLAKITTGLTTIDNTVDEIKSSVRTIQGLFDSKKQKLTKFYKEKTSEEKEIMKIYDAIHASYETLMKQLEDFDTLTAEIVDTARAATLGTEEETLKNLGPQIEKQMSMWTDVKKLLKYETSLASDGVAYTALAEKTIQEKGEYFNEVNTLELPQDVRNTMQIKASEYGDKFQKMPDEKVYWQLMMNYPRVILKSILGKKNLIDRLRPEDLTSLHAFFINFQDDITNKIVDDLNRNVSVNPTNMKWLEGQFFDSFKATFKENSERINIKNGDYDMLLNSFRSSGKDILMVIARKTEKRNWRDKLGEATGGTGALQPMTSLEGPVKVGGIPLEVQNGVVSIDKDTLDTTRDYSVVVYVSKSDKDSYKGQLEKSQLDENYAASQNEQYVMYAILNKKDKSIEFIYKKPEGIGRTPGELDKEI